MPPETCEDGLVYSDPCWWNLNYLNLTLDWVAALPGTRFWWCCRSWSTSWGASCCRWHVPWPFLLLQEDTRQVSDNTWECQADYGWNMLKSWQHWLRMAAISEGSWSSCDWRARCGRRWGSYTSYQESTEEFMFVFFSMGYDWEVVLWCTGSQKVLLLDWDFQRKLHGILWRSLYSGVCWWNCN